MLALPERAVAGFADALIGDRLGFLDATQRSTTARFVVERWRAAAQSVRLGTGAVAAVLAAAVWSLTALRGDDEEQAWRTIVRRTSARTPPGVDELTVFVLSLATAYASERWPDAPRVAAPAGPAR